VAEKTAVSASTAMEARNGAWKKAQEDDEEEEEQEEEEEEEGGVCLS
jgi:ribosomal protein L12E/L44/L45/RPP1/RPP2